MAIIIFKLDKWWMSLRWASPSFPGYDARWDARCYIVCLENRQICVSRKLNSKLRFSEHFHVPSAYMHYLSANSAHVNCTFYLYFVEAQRTQSSENSKWHKLALILGSSWVYAPSTLHWFSTPARLSLCSNNQLNTEKFILHSYKVCSE